MAEKEKVILATGANASAVVSSAQTTINQQAALNYTLVDIYMLNATNLMLQFVERPDYVATFEVDKVVVASNTAITTAVTTAQTTITTQEAAGWTLKKTVPMSTMSFCLWFVKAKP